MFFQYVKFNQSMNANKLVTVLFLLLANISTGQATTYNISAIFSDGGIQGKTLFNGQYDWNGSAVSNFSGQLTQAMWGWDETKDRYVPGSDVNGNVGAPPVLNLTYQLDGVSAPDADGDVTTSVFLLNNTNVFDGGGYATGDAWKYGLTDGNTPNENAYFTLAFNAADPTNTLTASDKIVYGDATPYGLMGPLETGFLAMTGHSVGGFGGSMGGYPVVLSIAPAAVPVPAAVWLFGTAIAGLLGVSRKRVLAA